MDRLKCPLCKGIISDGSCINCGYVIINEDEITSGYLVEPLSLNKEEPVREVFPENGSAEIYLDEINSWFDESGGCQGFYAESKLPEICPELDYDEVYPELKTVKEKEVNIKRFEIIVIIFCVIFVVAVLAVIVLFLFKSGLIQKFWDFLLENRGEKSFYIIDVLGFIFPIVGLKLAVGFYKRYVRDL